MAELIDRSKLMFLLERELDMNGITDWGKGYMEAIHDAMEHVKFMPTTTEADIRAKALKYAQSRFRHIYETMVANQMENCINWADMLDSMVAEQLKEELE